MKHIVLLFILTIFYNSYLDAQVWQGSYIIDSQAAANNFKTNCNCTEIRGDLRIIGSNVQQINGLSDLKKIEGDLNIETNGQLKNIDGLKNVTFIGGLIDINTNGKLEHIHGLSGLTSINDGLHLNRNNRLKHINGLSKITSFKGDGYYLYTRRCAYLHI